MTKPSEQQFLEFQELANSRPFEAIPTPRTGSFTPFDDSAAYFGQCWDKLASFRVELRETPLWRWFDSQDGFHRAMRAVATKGHGDPMEPEPRDEFVRQRTEQVINLLGTGKVFTGKRKRKRNARWPEDAATPDDRFRRFIEMSGTSNRPLRLYADIASAFRTYFYGSNTPNADQYRLVTTALETIEAIFVRVNQEVLPACQVLPAQSGALGSFGALETRLKNLSRVLDRERLRCFPKTRNDDTAPERRLVWDLRSAFRKAYSADKATAIVHLSCLTGIRRPPDRRAVERLLAGWREIEKGTSPAEAD